MQIKRADHWLTRPTKDKLNSVVRLASRTTLSNTLQRRWITSLEALCLYELKRKRVNYGIFSHALRYVYVKSTSANVLDLAATSMDAIVGPSSWVRWIDASSLRRLVNSFNCSSRSRTTKMHYAALAAEESQRLYVTRVINDKGAAGPRRSSTDSRHLCDDDRGLMHLLCAWPRLMKRIYSAEHLRSDVNVKLPTRTSPTVDRMLFELRAEPGHMEPQTVSYALLQWDLSYYHIVSTYYYK